MRRGAAPGFTLLEVLIAVAIFAFVAAAAAQTMVNTDYMAGRARRARELRMLAERKLGEVLTFEEEFDKNETTDGDFSDYREYGNQFAEWTWQVHIENVVVFGVSGQEDARYLFGTPTDEEKAKLTGTSSSAGAAQPGAPTKKQEKHEVREITVKVAAPADGSAADSVEIVLFAPVLMPVAAGTKK